MSGGKGGGQTVGYKYYMGLHAGLCKGPVDSLQEIRGGNLTLWSGSKTTSGPLDIAADKVYGGEQAEGGVSGKLDVMMGDQTQGVNSYLSSVLDGIMPAFRGLLSLVFRQGYIGANNPYPKPWSFRVERILKGWDASTNSGDAWYPPKAVINLKTRRILQEFSIGLDIPLGGAMIFFGDPSTSPSFTQALEGVGPYPVDAEIKAGTPDSDPSIGVLGTFISTWTYLAINRLPVYGSHSPGQSSWRGQEVIYGLPATHAVEVRGMDTFPGAYPNWPGWQTGIGPGALAKFYVEAVSPGFNGMNPAHIIYEVLTDRDWGMGYPTAIIDNAAFTAAADQLYTEGFGLCLLWNRQDTIENFLQTVIDYIGAVIVQSRTTGLFQLNLIRGGYDPSTLPAFTADDVIEMISYESPSITGAVNEIVVNWFDPEIKAAQSTTVQALGAIQAQGVIVSQAKDYPGLATFELASRVAKRDLRATSVPLKRIKVKLNRKGYALLPGGLFRLSFPAYGIATMIFRIGDVDYGSLTEGAITFTAVQDVFSLPDTVFAAFPMTSWVKSDSSAQPAQYYKGFEVTYRDLAHTLTSTEFKSIDAASGFAGLVVARPTSLSAGYDLETRTGSADFVMRGGANFCPTGLTTGALTPFGTSVTVASGLDLDLVEVPCAAMLGNEIVNVTAFDHATGIATIARGCIDTVPVAHASGLRMWFYDSYVASDQIEYFTGETVDMKPLTLTTSATLDPTLAPTVSTSIVERQNLPYPPANFYVDGIRWDTVTKLSGSTVALTWAGRNRVTQMDQMIDNTAGAVTPEAGTTYTVVISDQTGTPVITQTGITGTSWTSGMIPSTATSISITLTAVRAGLSSYQSQVLPLTIRVGYGFDYGFDYGGGM